jgi:hypothetical protein
MDMQVSMLAVVLAGSVATNVLLVRACRGWRKMHAEQHEVLIHTVEARNLMADKAVKLEQWAMRLDKECKALCEENTQLKHAVDPMKLHVLQHPFPPVPKGYEPYTPEFVEAIRSTTMTHADRQNKTQDEVFAQLADPGEEPPPAKEDAQ